MRISTFLYTLWQGIRNIWKNKMFSLASIATMSACIFLFGIFYSVVVNFQSVVREVESGVAVTVFFEDGLPQAQMDAIGEQIGKRAEVSKKRFVSADETWEEFQKVYFEGSEEIAKDFTEDNPLANSAHYEVYMNDISMQQSLVTFIESLNGVQEVKSSDAAANTLTDFNSLIGYVSAGIILILLCVAVFLISNTVTIGIAVRREEIGIMKLIGATDFFVRAPFIVEGILIGLVGSVIPLSVLFIMYRKIISYVGERFRWLNGILDFLPVEEVFATLLPVALVLGVGIGFLGSFMTIRKHLRV
ncbi:MAG: ABC transporter permease [Lachnospiraceae bacterium]|nr:ABC transporter permease [Lachnospiraceae bacterium]